MPICNSQLVESYFGPQDYIFMAKNGANASKPNVVCKEMILEIGSVLESIGMGWI